MKNRQKHSRYQPMVCMRSTETYVLLEATITTFSFARLIQPQVKEVIVANTYELKQISLARKKTDKVDADKLCRILKMQVLSGEKAISPVSIPPVEIQDLRGFFSTYRLYKKKLPKSKTESILCLRKSSMDLPRKRYLAKRAGKR